MGKHRLTREDRNQLKGSRTTGHVTVDEISGTHNRPQPEPLLEAGEQQCE